MEEEENRALQTINETPAEKAAKRRKLNEEVEDLKRHLEIMPDEDDDVYTESTPLARKVLVVDYEIIKLNNKPYYKIIRADGTHQLYISFMTLLKNFDREDLEALWNLVKSGRIKELFMVKQRKEVPTLKIYSRPDVECCKTSGRRGKVSLVAYKLELPGEFRNVYNTFHASNLKTCLFDESLVIPMKELRLDDKLNFVEEPVEIMDQEVKQLRQSRIPIVKVRWNSKRGLEFTWEREDQIQAKYPHLFSTITPKSN
nr:putative reverse transcriptase domain-containing protein [Tanacetum cinerariifolium]